ncbi:MAG: hypothetical protein M3464_14730 [Chloroflexota bacterium]|nr:hypothetical protein [Chloroflexota bacterium]
MVIERLQIGALPIAAGFTGVARVVAGAAVLLVIGELLALAVASIEAVLTLAFVVLALGVLTAVAIAIASAAHFLAGGSGFVREPREERGDEAGEQPARELASRHTGGKQPGQTIEPMRFHG